MQGNLLKEEDSNIDLHNNTRFILYHKTPTSGRTVFFRQKQGGVSVFKDLPALAQVVDDIVRPDTENDVVPMPGSLLKELSEWLQVDMDEFEIDNEFYEKVDAAGGPITIYLIRFKNIDPPYDAAERVDGKFVLLTEMRDLVPTELELLRRAYVAIMEG